MKKYFVFALLIICLLFSGCSKDSNKSVIKNINDLFNRVKYFCLTV